MMMIIVKNVSGANILLSEARKSPAGARILVLNIVVTSRLTNLNVFFLRYLGEFFKSILLSIVNS